MIKKSNHLNRLVTLSPLTEMARNFHLKNGAEEVSVNEGLKILNIGYKITLTNRYLLQVHRYVFIYPESLL